MNSLTPYLRTRATAIWAVLMVATVISWILGSDHSFMFRDTALATCLVVAISFLKVQLVGTHFMELDHAPRNLARLFTAWVLLTCAVVIAIYLWA